jgi:hypothetical protein
MDGVLQRLVRPQQTTVDETSCRCSTQGALVAFYCKLVAAHLTDWRLSPGLSGGCSHPVAGVEPQAATLSDQSVAIAGWAKVTVAPLMPTMVLLGPMPVRMK